MIGGKTAPKIGSKVKGTSTVATHSELLNCSTRCMWLVMLMTVSSKIRTSNSPYYTCTLTLVNVNFPFYCGTEVASFRFWSKFMRKIHCFSFRTDFGSGRVSYRLNKMWVWFEGCKKACVSKICSILHYTRTANSGCIWIVLKPLNICSNQIIDLTSVPFDVVWNVSVCGQDGLVHVIAESRPTHI